MIPLKKLPEVIIFAAFATFLLWATSPKDMSQISQAELYARIIGALVVSGITVRFAFKWFRHA